VGDVRDKERKARSLSLSGKGSSMARVKQINSCPRPRWYETQYHKAF